MASVDFGSKRIAPPASPGEFGSRHPPQGGRQATQADCGAVGQVLLNGETVLYIWPERKSGGWELKISARRCREMCSDAQDNHFYQQQKVVKVKSGCRSGISRCAPASFLLRDPQTHYRGAQLRPLLLRRKLIPELAVFFTAQFARPHVP